MSGQATWEKWYHLVGGAAVAVVAFFLVPTFPVPPESAPSLFSATISLSAIAVGFLATTKSILFTIDRRRIVSQLRASGHFDTLVGYLLTAVNWSFALAIFSGLCFVVDLKKPADWHHLFLTAWLLILATAGFACFACFRVVRVFGTLLRSPD